MPNCDNLCHQAFIRQDSFRMSFFGSRGPAYRFFLLALRICFERDMPVVKLLQIGDMHLQSTLKPFLDYKDKAFPDGLANAIAISPVQAVMRALVSICERNRSDFAGVIICGDLADKGDLGSYEKCLGYLSDNLRFHDKWTSDQIHVVPGNHDIHRKDCDPSGLNLYTKFDPLIELWAKLGLNVLAAREVRQTRVEANGQQLELFSLNSCIGCGERRSLPKNIQDELHKLLNPPTGALDIIWEQLDTPAFLESDINRITAALEEDPDIAIGVVVTHHNLLPQAEPRIEIYTEVINGGLVRSRLAQCPQTVIYCHGHVHDDPVEVILNPNNCTSRLVCISSPRFDMGFNVIEIHYSRQTNIPIGCVVIRFRHQRDGAVRPIESLRVPLLDIRGAGQLEDNLARLVLQNTTSEPDRFDVIRNKLGSPTKPTRSVLADVFRDLEWLGFLEIQNRQEPFLHWH